MMVHVVPRVYLVGRQTLDESELDRFLRDNRVDGWSSDSEVGSEVLCEVAGRTCYMSFAKPRPGGNKDYLAHIQQSRHGSVLEHAVYNLLITGVSRTLTHELVRHRAGWSYSQLSQRYVDESECEVVVPHELRKEILAARQWLADNETKAVDALTMPEVLDDEGLQAGMLWVHMMEISSKAYVVLTSYLSKRVSREGYRKYLEKTVGVKDFVQWTPEQWESNSLDAETRRNNRKTARGTARSVLPNATETKIFCTVNARAARHFLEQRCSPHAEVEIRKLAYVVWQVLRDASPNLFGDYQEVSLEDGTIALTTPNPKV